MKVAGAFASARGAQQDQSHGVPRRVLKWWPVALPLGLVAILSGQRARIAHIPTQRLRSAAASLARGDRASAAGDGEFVGGCAPLVLQLPAGGGAGL